MLKYFLLILSIFLLISCGNSGEGCKEGSYQIPNSSKKSISELSEWEKHFNITYDDIKKEIEGTYQIGDTEDIFYIIIDTSQELTYFVRESEKSECAENIGFHIIATNGDKLTINGSINFISLNYYDFLPENVNQFPTFKPSKNFCYSEDQCYEMIKISDEVPNRIFE